VGFDDKNNTINSEKFFKVERCSEEFYAHTEMEHEFWRINKGAKFYCLQDPDAFLLGTRDNIILHKETTFWVYEVLRCDNSLRARTLKDPTCVETETNKCEYNYDKDENGDFIDPPCADDKDIDKWLKNISITSKLMN
jgi:hypothetical protein